MTIQDLKSQNLLLLECISGSKAYGLDTPTSDTDIKGVYYLPRDQFYGLKYIDQISNESNDIVYYELGKFVSLLLRNNPNMLELLATPAECILFRHPLMDELPLSLFLSRLCLETFAGYASTQIHKARGYNKKVVNPVDAVRKSVTDFCYILDQHTSVPLQQWLTEHGYEAARCGLVAVPHAKGVYALFYDRTGALCYSGISSGDTANEVSLSAIPQSERMVAYLSFNKEGYSTYCKSYREYWDWVERRNEIRFATNQQHGKAYDAKNMMHTIRLLQVVIDIFTTGTLPVRRTNREELLAIKHGAYEYKTLIAWADDLLQQARTACGQSSLQDAPDYDTVVSKLTAMRNTLYQ